MSDVVIVAIITVIGSLLSLITKELFAMHKTVRVVNEKVDKVSKDVNGHMTKLLALTKKDGVQKGKDEQIKIDKKK